MWHCFTELGAVPEPYLYQTSTLLLTSALGFMFIILTHPAQILLWFEVKYPSQAHMVEHIVPSLW